jgi:nondiscriminating aspartyl-tRNA synthetase
MQMERVLSSELHRHVGQRVLLAGWLQRRRELKSVTFLIVRDRRGLAQVVVSESGRTSPDELTEETVVEIVGTVVANAQAPGGVEIVEPTIEILSSRAEVLPFDLFRPEISATLPTQLDHAALALRHPIQRALFGISATSVSAFRSTLDGMDFTEVQTPKIVGSATESGANVFAIDYFGRPAYLAQSPQFYKQTMVGVFERVYEVGPVFRAEPHDTTRHLAEYVSLDAELGFIDDHTTVMEVLTCVIAGMLERLTEKRSRELELLNVQLPQVESEIPAVHFADALEMISTATGEDRTREPDLAPSDERWLGEWARVEHGSEFVFVTGYPTRKRPFYTHPEPERPQFSNSFDLLFRGVELVTGGQRLHRYEDYLRALDERGQDPSELRAYLEAFRHGMPEHGGFAIGLERWTSRLTERQNIREATLFPRDRNRLSP